MAKHNDDAAETMARMMGSSAKACHLPHPCRICGAEPKGVVSTVHLNGKHTLSSCGTCGKTLDRLIRDGRLSLADARNDAKARAAIKKHNGGR